MLRYYALLESKGAFHLSELTGQVIPFVMRISLSMKTVSSQTSQILNSMHEGRGFLAKPFDTSLFHF